MCVIIMANRLAFRFIHRSPYIGLANGKRLLTSSSKVALLRFYPSDGKQNFRSALEMNKERPFDFVTLSSSDFHIGKFVIFVHREFGCKNRILNLKEL